MQDLVQTDTGAEAALGGDMDYGVAQVANGLLGGQLVDFEELVARTELARKWLKRMIAKGEIPLVKIGNRYWFNLKSVEKKVLALASEFDVDGHRI